MFNSDGSLDPTFGSGGKVTTNWGSNAEQINGLAFQADQGQLKLVAVGEFAGGSTNHEYAVACYLPTGSLDPSFGTGGEVVTSVDPSGADAAAAVVQSDGKIVVTGAGPNVTMARYNSDGTIDPTFGSGGIVSTTMAGGLSLIRSPPSPTTSSLYQGRGADVWLRFDIWRTGR